MESRQSPRPKRRTASSEPLLRGFGIKAKHGPCAIPWPYGASAPRFWNQGKATARFSRRHAMSLCSAVLESRQSCRPVGLVDPARASAPRFWNQGKARHPIRRRRGESLCSAVLESRQSAQGRVVAPSREPLLRGFGIKAKRDVAPGERGIGASAPRFWNQGKALAMNMFPEVGSLCSAVLESRQSYYRHTMRRLGEPLLRGFGIKAKHGPCAIPWPYGASAPRFWNQGKARSVARRRSRRSLCSAVLESRQSSREPDMQPGKEPLLRGFGIKAKPPKRFIHQRRRASAPRFWNQGKAFPFSALLRKASLCSAVLESRQSVEILFEPGPSEPLLRGFGIKAKPAWRVPGGGARASAPRFWNQGKAAIRRLACGRPSLCSAVLESRQSVCVIELGALWEPLLRGFGIKAKHRRPDPARGRRASAPRFWNQGKAPTAADVAGGVSLCSAVLESRQSIKAASRRMRKEPLLRGFGIKAKRVNRCRKIRIGASAPRFWNQGKARQTSWCPRAESLCSAVLESRQSRGRRRCRTRPEPLLRGFGIKAKRRRWMSFMRM